MMPCVTQRSGHTGGQKGIALIAVVLIILLAIGVVAATAISVYHFWLKPRPPELSAKLMPPETEVYLTLNLRPGASQLIKFRSVFNRFKDIEGFEDVFNDLMKKLEEEVGIDLKQDVFPWLVEVAVGAVDVSPPDKEPEVIFLAGTADRKSTERVLDKLLKYMETRGQRKFSSGEYRGYEYYTDNDRQHYAITEDYLIFSSNKKHLEELIDRIKDGGPSLVDETKFQTVQKALPKERLGLIYADTETILKQAVAKAEAEHLKAETLQQVEDRLPSAVGLSAAFIDRGFRLDLYANIKGKKMPLLKPDRLTSARLLPHDVLGLLSFADMATIWRETRSALKEGMGPKSKLLEEGLRMMPGIGLDAFFEQVTGETAIALLPGKAVAAPYGSRGGVRAVALLEAGDRDKAQDLLNDVKDMIERMGMKLDRVSIDQREAMVLKRFPAGGYSPGFMVLDRFLVMGTGEDTLAQLVDISEGKGLPLAKNKAFAQPLDLLGDKNLMLYINLQKVINMVAGSLPHDYEHKYLPYLKPLETFLIAGSATPEAGTATFLITISE